MALLAHRGLWLTRSGFARDPMTPAAFAPDAMLHDGLVQAMATGDLRLACASNLQLYSSAHNVLLGAGGMSNVVSVSSNLVEIRGDVLVLGSLDAVATTELHVRDKLLRIGYDGGGGVVPDVALDGAGIELGGGAPAAAGVPASYYEHSFRWRRAAGAGLGAMLTPGGASNEPFWELRGGGLRLTTPCRAAGGSGEVSYGMHINDREELVTPILLAILWALIVALLCLWAYMGDAIIIADAYGLPICHIYRAYTEKIGYPPDSQHLHNGSSWVLLLVQVGDCFISNFSAAGAVEWIARVAGTYMTICSNFI